MLERIIGLAACALLAAAGCSGEAVIDGFGGANAGGGTTSTTSTTSSSGQAGSGGTMTVKCGPNLPPCGQDELCDLPSGANCEGEGSCEKRPEGCQQDCPGVCGCDTLFYCNSCLANAAGVETSSDTACTNEQASYGAHAWPGGLDHIIIKKQNDTDGRCVWLMADAPTSGQFGVTIPSPWGVNQIIAYATTDGCMSTTEQPMAPSADAASASGSISWTLDPGKLYPCELNIDVTAHFDNPPPWLTWNLKLAATDVPLVGGCF